MKRLALCLGLTALTMAGLAAGRATAESAGGGRRAADAWRLAAAGT